MVMTNLLLQKPSKHSKSNDHLKALERRLNLWNEGNLKDLLLEGNTIQANLKSFKKSNNIAEISKKFASEMQKGNVNGAIKLLSDNMQNNILPLNASTLNSLKLKHPEAKKAASEVLFDDIVSSIHPVKFEEISGESVRKAAIRTKGESGPSDKEEVFINLLNLNSAATKPSKPESSSTTTTKGKQLLSKESVKFT
eukprot:gene6354-7082_t